MMTNLIKKYGDDLKGAHLIYVLIFLVAIVIRLFASLKSPINSFEASILLNITNHSSSYPEGISIIQSLLIKTSFFIFGESDLAARIWSIIAGSLLVFSPLYLTDQIKAKSAILLSVFISIDPFMITNSIQIGSNIFAIFGLVNLIGLIWKNRINAAIIFLLLLVSSGRGLFFSFVVCAVLFAFNSDFNDKLKEEFFNWAGSWKKKTRNSKYVKVGVFGFILFFLIIIFRIDLSAILSDFIHIFGSFFGEQLQLSSIFLYPIILFSYLPLLAITTVMVLITYWKKDKYIFKLIFIWILFIFILLSVNQYFKSFDLIWISCPLIIFSVLINQELIDNFCKDYEIRNLGLLILAVSFVSFSINLFSLIYQGVSGFSQYSTFISLISTIIIIISLGVFFAVQFGLSYVAYMPMKAIFIFLFVFQIGISFRASGLAGSPYYELLWAGNIADTSQLKKQIELQKQTEELSTDDIEIGLLKYIEPGILWELRSYQVEQFKGLEFPKEKFDILLSKTEISEETPYRYYGQKIIENANPIWTNKPFGNIFFSDYWSWMTIRRSKIAESFYYMYIYTEQ